MSKRSRGEGSVRQRPDGRYEARIWVTTADGERKRVSGYGDTAKAAIEARTKKAAALAAGAPVRSSRATLAEVAAQWRKHVLPVDYPARSTQDLYRSRCEVHIERAPIGAVRLCDLTPGHIQRWIATKSGAASSLRQDLIIMRHILSMAKRDKLIRDSPAADVKLPKAPRGEAAHLSMQQVTALLAAAEKRTRYGLAVRLLATTGMRRGEALALRWRDLDLTTGEVVICGTIVGNGSQLTRQPYPKGKKPRRLALPADLLERLRLHRAAQNRDRLAAGPDWADREGLVFTTRTGRPVDGRRLLTAVKAAARDLGLPDGVVAHTLRHSVATHLLHSAGVAPDVVGQLLGHSSVDVTLGIYSHVSGLDVASAVSHVSTSLSGVNRPAATPTSTPNMFDNDQPSSDSEVG